MLDYSQNVLHSVFIGDAQRIELATSLGFLQHFALLSIENLLRNNCQYIVGDNG